MSNAKGGSAARGAANRKAALAAKNPAEFARALGQSEKAFRRKLRARGIYVSRGDAFKPSDHIDWATGAKSTTPKRARKSAARKASKANVTA